MALRYLLVMDPGMGYGGSLASTSLNLSGHYSSYISKKIAMQQKAIQERIVQEVARIMKEKEAKASMEKVLKRKEEEKAQKLKDEEERAKKEALAREVKEAEEIKQKELEKMMVGKGTPAANKRIMNEYKALNSSKDFKNFVIEMQPDNIYVWQLKFDILKFDLTKEIKADFQEYARLTGQSACLIFEMRFPEGFPFEPPFIRVVSPRFAFHTGHITIGGSICMQILTNSGKISYLLRKIIQ